MRFVIPSAFELQVFKEHLFINQAYFDLLFEDSMYVDFLHNDPLKLTVESVNTFFVRLGQNLARFEKYSKGVMDYSQYFVDIEIGIVIDDSNNPINSLTFNEVHLIPNL